MDAEQTKGRGRCCAHQQHREVATIEPERHHKQEGQTDTGQGRMGNGIPDQRAFTQE